MTSNKTSQSLNKTAAVKKNTAKTSTGLSDSNKVDLHSGNFYVSTYLSNTTKKILG